MSSSRTFLDGLRQQQSKAPERSNFVNTCNRLSQFIKEKGSLRDLNVEYGGKLESLEAIVKPGSTHAAPTSSTMNLLTNLGKSPAQPSTEQRPFVENLPRFATPDNFIDLVEDDESEKANTSKDATTSMEASTSQLTIFYGGKVLVFEDFSDERAKKLVSFAEKESAKRIPTGILSNSLQQERAKKCVSFAEKESVKIISSNTLQEKHNIVVASTSPVLPPRPPVGNSHNTVPISWNHCKEKASTSTVVAMAPISRPEEHVSVSVPFSVSVSPQPEANGSDLPIARRSSLHRFLAKRKDRSVARGPYHRVEEQPGSSSSSKGEEQLELKL